MERMASAQLLDDGHRLLKGEPLRWQLAGKLFHRLAFHDFHGQEHRVCDLVSVEVGNDGDVLMREALLLGCLPLQRNGRLWVFTEVSVEQLDDNVRISVAGPHFVHVASPPYCAHAAFAKLLPKLNALSGHLPGPEFAVLGDQIYCSGHGTYVPGQAVDFGASQSGLVPGHTLRVVGETMAERSFEAIEADFALLEGCENRGNFRL